MIWREWVPPPAWSRCFDSKSKEGFENFMNSIIVLLKTFDFKKTSQSLVIFGVVMQLCLWVIPGTIALRQILLALTLIPSLFLLRGYLRFLTFHKAQLIPTLLLLCLLIWVVIHLIFFSYDFELELKQFTSLWLRAIVGIIIGFSLGFGLVVTGLFSWLFIGFSLVIFS